MVARLIVGVSSPAYDNNADVHVRSFANAGPSHRRAGTHNNKHTHILVLPVVVDFHLGGSGETLNSTVGVFDAAPFDDGFERQGGGHSVVNLTGIEAFTSATTPTAISDRVPTLPDFFFVTPG